MPISKIELIANALRGLFNERERFICASFYYFRASRPLPRDTQAILASTQGE
jgi:hypothetical protein